MVKGVHIPIELVMLAGINLDIGNVKMKPFNHKLQNKLPWEVQKYIYIYITKRSESESNVARGHYLRNS